MLFKIKLFLPFLIFFIVVVFTSSCKKKHSCACEIDIYWFTDNPGGTIDTYNNQYSSLQTIDEKVTKKQAEDICIQTENSLKSTLVKRHYNCSASGSCVVK